MTQDTLEGLARFRLFGRSPLNAYLRMNELIWTRLPRWMKTLRPMTWYGRFLHSLVLARPTRQMYLGTFFFRNRPELQLISRLVSLTTKSGGLVRIAVLGCSNGAEVYSIAYSLRSAQPGVRFALDAVDISAAAVDAARAGVYPRGVSDLVKEPIFQRTTAEEIEDMFEADGDGLRVKPWVREGIDWHVGDAADPELAALLGSRDIVVANRFLCHMAPPDAEASLRAVGRLVAPGGYLFVSGVDLDVRTRVATALGWKAVCDSIEEVHDGDSSVRDSWPVKYWGLEPIDKGRSDWRVRYASVFQLG
jgi:SAM-dependent methyltransferase